MQRMEASLENRNTIGDKEAIMMGDQMSALLATISFVAGSVLYRAQDSCRDRCCSQAAR